MPNRKQLTHARARQALYRALRGFFSRRGFEEVETPCLVPTPGMEPHITAFEVPFVPEMHGSPRTLYLHTSPEYTMKRLLADGAGPIFQICKAFRNGEVSSQHNPEFSLLEFYRPDADYHAIMSDLEHALAEAEGEFAGSSFFSQTPYARLSVKEAIKQYAGFDLPPGSDAEELAALAKKAGVRVGTNERFDDVFFHLFLQKVEPQLGFERPTFLVEYPASMASLARLKPSDSSVAERFELYVRGVELANGFSELTCALEQRARFLEEQRLRKEAGKPVYALDERFLEAVGRMPPSSGVAVGLDRILMLLLNEGAIDDVLLFPAREFL